MQVIASVAIYLLFCAAAADAAPEVKSSMSPGRPVPAKNASQLSADPEDESGEWLERLEKASESLEKGADFFKALDEEEETSEAFAHAGKLIGALSSLIGGFLGDPTDSYVKAIKELQQQLDGAIARLQQQIAELMSTMDDTFLRIFLAPRSHKLQQAVADVTAFLGSDDKVGQGRKILEAQMEPISVRLQAWEEIIDCFLGRLESCPPTMLNIVLNNGKLWPRPAVLINFAMYHYALLSSSATAICAYQKLIDKACGLESRLAQLGDITKRITAAQQGMTDQWTSSLGANSIPTVLEQMVLQYPNQDFDSAKAIAEAAGEELDKFYFSDGLWSHFGARTWFIQITDDDFSSNEVVCASRTSAFKDMSGYQVLFDVMDKDTVYLSDDDCRDGDASAQIECMRSELGDDVGMSVYYRLGEASSDSQHFSYTYYSSGALFHKYCCDDDSGFDLRVVDAATDSQVSSQSTPCMPRTQSCAESHGTHGISLPLGRARSKSLAVKAPGGPPKNLASTKLILRSGDAPDPEDFMKHMSDVCNTFGAFAAFCGPEGEIVGAAFELVGAIFGLIGALFGIGKPDPVIEAIRAAEKDLMGRMLATSDDVRQAEQTLLHEALANLLDNAQGPLRQLLTAWGTAYPQGNASSAIASFKNAVDPISGPIESWTFLAQCLAGRNPDCFLGGQSVFAILLNDGQNFMRPAALISALRYYYLLLQRSAVAICGYGRMVLGSQDGCPLMPSMKDDLEKLGQAMSDAVKGMLDQWTSSLGANSIPTVLEQMVHQYPNQDFDGAKAIAEAAGEELDKFYFSDGLWSHFGARTWFIQITDDDFSSNEVVCASRTSAFKEELGYQVLFDVMDKDTVYLSDDDCRDGDATAQIECMRSELGDDVGMSVYYRRGEAASDSQHFSYTYHSSGALYHKYCCDDDSGFDLRVVDSATDSSVAVLTGGYPVPGAKAGEVQRSTGRVAVPEAIGSGKNESLTQARQSHQAQEHEGGSRHLFV